MKLLIVAGAGFAFSFVAFLVFMDLILAHNPSCPGDWPDIDTNAAVLNELHHTDDEGNRWVVFGSHPVLRAYPVDERYEQGYVVGSPHEICYWHLTRNEQIYFPDDDEEVEAIVTTPVPTAFDPFAKWNDLEPQHWWRESEPYSCLTPAKFTSPWIEAGMTDLGGSDPLSLIKYYGNGSYLRYGYMGFEGCTPIKKYPDRTYLDPPVDPTYYSLGNLDIAVDIARVPPDAPGWFADNGKRETMPMAEAVDILNTHVAAYFEKISEGKLKMRFHAGNDFNLEGEGSPNDVHGQQMRLAGVMDCRGEAANSDPCNLGAPGGLNRILLTDVTTDTGRRRLQRGSATRPSEPARSEHGESGARNRTRLDGLASFLFRGAVARRGRRASQSVRQHTRFHVNPRHCVTAYSRLASEHAINSCGEPLCCWVD